MRRGKHNALPLTAPDNKAGELVGVAAHRLADNWEDALQPHTKVLREYFGLSFLDAVKAIVEAKQLREMGRD